MSNVIDNGALVSPAESVVQHPRNPSVAEGFLRDSKSTRSWRNHKNRAGRSYFGQHRPAPEEYGIAVGTTLQALVCIAGTLRL